MHCNRVFAPADAVIPSVLIPAQTGNSYVSKCEQKQTISLAVHFALFYNSAPTRKVSFQEKPPFFHSLLPNCQWFECTALARSEQSRCGCYPDYLTRAL